MSTLSSDKKFIKGFWQVADPKIWIASTIPMVLGVILSLIYDKGYNVFWMILSFIGIYLIETGKNAINECIDYISGADRMIDKEHKTPFSGGKKTITSGLLTVKQSAFIGVMTMTAAALSGLAIVLFKEPKVLIIGLAGIVIAILYSLPPFKFCYRGFGEIAVGVTFGPLILNGMYVVMSGRFDVLPVLISIPIGLLITNVLWINQFPDYEADKAAGKRNGVVRMGKEKAIKVYILIFILAYLSIIPIIIYTRSFIWLMTILTMPVALKAVKTSKESYDNIPELVAANAATIKIYVLTGLLFIISMLAEVYIL